MRLRSVVLTVALVSCPSLSAAQTVVFSDDFESGTLDQWTGKYVGPHSGVVVADPLNAGNLVVSFLQPTASGDIFSDEFRVAPDYHVTLKFDYLGLAVEGSTPGNFGGFIGYADDTIPQSGLGRWLAGTDGTSGADPILIDDGAWHSYVITFDPYGETPPPQNNVLRIIAEDFHAPPGDVFFDNIVVELVAPVTIDPSSWSEIKSSYR